MSCYYYGTTTVDQRQGLQRQVFFWSRLLPIVADYYWHFGSKSPRKWLMQQIPDAVVSLRKATTTLDGDDDDDDAHTRLARLHAKHAPAALQVMLDLKGLDV